MGKMRHLLGLSGGKDSAALAIYLRDKIPEMEYYFCDTGKELPETHEFLAKVEARLGIHIERLSAERDFDHYLSVYNGYLPSARMRWCTRMLKIIPFEKWVGDDEAISYIAIRADENRKGYISTKPNLKPSYPFIDDGINKADVIKILEESGIGIPSYYSWRSRSGCFFCFFQRRYEWVKLSEKHPDLFEQAAKYETQHSDGRIFFWNENESLKDLLSRKDKIIAEHEKYFAREVRAAPNRPLSEVLESVLDGDNSEKPCLICQL